MATSTQGSDWMSRMQKRNDLAMTMLKRPAQNDARSSSTSSEPPRASSPRSASSSHSEANSSLSSIDESVILEMQFKKNEAQIKANEERMRFLKSEDDRMAREIQERMSAVMQLNQQLRLMNEMLARAERVSQGEFGVQPDEI